MPGLLPSHQVSSGFELWSGIPSVANWLDDLVDSYEDLVSDALDYAISEENKVAKTAVAGKGFDLTISHDRNGDINYVITGDTDAGQRYLENEYGTPNKAPAATVRKLVNRNQIVKLVDKRIKESV